MTEAVALELTSAITGRDPKCLAAAIKNLADEGKQLIKAEDWSALAELTTSADTALQNARSKGELAAGNLTLLADMAQQMLAVFSFAAQSNGDPQTGYFRAALTHARRLDTMTGGQFRLEAIVNQIKTAHQSD